MKKVSIVGLGWLGMPLALNLMRQGYDVTGSKTTAEGVAAARVAGIDACELRLTPQPECDADAWDNLMKCDVLMINLPAKREAGAAETYRQSVQCLVDSALSYAVPRVMFISSTSVYGDTQGLVTEESVCRPSQIAGETLVALENWLHNLPKLQVDILRPAGLVGPDRHPARSLAGRQGLPNGNDGVNLVHLEDVMAAISLVLAQPQGGHRYNLCASLHPRRDDYYPQMARKLGLPEPTFIATGDQPGGHVVDGQRICRELGFEYRFSDPYLMMI